METNLSIGTAATELRKIVAELEAAGGQDPLAAKIRSAVELIQYCEYRIRSTTDENLILLQQMDIILSNYFISC